MVLFGISDISFILNALIEYYIQQIGKLFCVINHLKTFKNMEMLLKDRY